MPTSADACALSKVPSALSPSRSHRGGEFNDCARRLARDEGSVLPSVLRPLINGRLSVEIGYPMGRRAAEHERVLRPGTLN